MPGPGVVTPLRPVAATSPPPPALVAVDFGTSSTCVAVEVPGEAPRVVVIDGGPLMSSAVYAEPTGLVVGAEADRRAALDPSRYEAHPKRRVDEGALLLGSAVVPVVDAWAAVLRRAVSEARAVLGGRPVATLVLTHPADWGGVRTGVLRQAATGLAGEVALVAEPIAAAVLHGRDLPAGAVLAVLDVGGGTTDVSVLRRDGGARTGGGFRVLATGGDPTFGGADIDEALLALLGNRLVGVDRERWDAVLAGRGLAERRRVRTLRGEVRAAKESLSRHAFTDVPLPAGLPDAHVSRDEMESLMARPVAAVVGLLTRVLRDAGAVSERGPGGSGVRSLAPVYLVGGTSRVPLIARTLHRELGVVAVLTDQPETVVARGAVLHVAGRVAPVTHVLRAGPPSQAGAVPAGPVPGQSSGSPAAPTPPGRRSRRRLLVGVAAGSLVVLGVAGIAAGLRLRPGPASTTREVTVGQARVVAPTGWAEAQRTDPVGTETGATARVVLSPDGTTTTRTRLVLQQTVLAPGANVDSVAEELRSQVAAATAGSYTGFAEGVAFAGREVTGYQEHPGAADVVDWYVVVEGRSQLSVGCRHPDDDPTDIVAVCEQAVRAARAS